MKKEKEVKETSKEPIKLQRYQRWINGRKVVVEATSLKEARKLFIKYN